MLDHAARLNLDVLYAVVREVSAIRTKETCETLCSLARTSSAVRKVCLPVLFAEVQWPKPDILDEEGGLDFFPESLLPHFKRFSLTWPDHWPDATPPLWGDKFYQGGDYHPRHIDKLVLALPRMSSLLKFQITCPFYPPNAIFTALISCPSLRDLFINDTPLYISMIPRVPAHFHLERLALVPVAEAIRVGEGPHDAKYHEVAYYIREYRKKYKNDVLARYAAADFLFKVGKPQSLRYVQLSGDLCTLDDIGCHEWPNLQTLVLTGHPPRAGSYDLVDIIARAPKLSDLRLLFTKSRGDSSFRVIPSGAGLVSARNNYASRIGQVKYLAMSNACVIDGVFHHTASLERLAMCAIIDLPRVPIALSRSDIDCLLADISVGTSASRLTHLRVMVEDKVNPGLCHAIAMHCPMLQSLEIELCGYHDGKSIFAWSEFSDPFSTLVNLRELRLCIQFPEFDENDTYEPWRSARKECALYMATHLPHLRRVGFEYRKRAGTHRYEDSWLEYDIERSSKRGIELFELLPSWYPFPEVWHPVTII